MKTTESLFYALTQKAEFPDGYRFFLPEKKSEAWTDGTGKTRIPPPCAQK